MKEDLSELDMEQFKGFASENKLIQFEPEELEAMAIQTHIDINSEEN